MQCLGYTQLAILYLVSDEYVFEAQTVEKLAKGYEKLYRKTSKKQLSFEKFLDRLRKISPAFVGIQTGYVANDKFKSM